MPAVGAAKRSTRGPLEVLWSVVWGLRRLLLIVGRVPRQATEELPVTGFALAIDANRCQKCYTLPSCSCTGSVATRVRYRAHFIESDWDCQTRVRRGDTSFRPGLTIRRRGRLSTLSRLRPLRAVAECDTMEIKPPRHHTSESRR
jgi:hypothetical protein